MANPYLPAMGEAITNQVTNNLNRNILPTMRRSTVASGGWGNSGAGLAQGLAVGETNQGLSNSLSNLWGQSWNADQDRANQASIAANQVSAQRDIAAMNDATNRYGLGNQFTLGLGNLGLGYTKAGQDYTLGLGGLSNQAFANDTSRIGTVGGLENQRLGLDQSYNLGLGNLDLNRTGQQQQFYTAQRGQDLTQQQNAFNNYFTGLNANLGLGQAQTNIGNQEYNAGLNPVQAYGSGLSPFTGLNSSSSTTTPQTGGGLAGAVGGGLTAAQLLQLLQGMGD